MKHKKDIKKRQCPWPVGIPMNFPYEIAMFEKGLGKMNGLVILVMDSTGSNLPKSEHYLATVCSTDTLKIICKLCINNGKHIVF